MRISVCGTETKSVLEKLETTLSTQVKTPWGVDGKSGIVDYAAETYKYDNEPNVIFSGSPFDFLIKNAGEGYNEVYEQIAINSLHNIDYIVVITSNMERKHLNVYKEYAELMPKKFRFFETEEEFIESFK